MSPHQPPVASPGDHLAHQLGDPALEAVVVHDPRKLRLILISMCTALVAVIASVSGLNVAQQQLAADLGASQNTLLWIINGYTMVLAALLLPVGAIGDRWGRRSVLLVGLGVFAGASVAAALATSTTLMLLARLVAGAGAAMIMPVTLSVVTSSFPEDKRANAIGVWAGFAGAGGILGLFFSAAMVDWFSWRWLFVMPIALCAIAFALTVANVENSREVHEHSFDVLGGVLSAIAIGGIVGHQKARFCERKDAVGIFPIAYAAEERLKGRLSSAIASERLAKRMIDAGFVGLGKRKPGARCVLPERCRPSVVEAAGSQLFAGDCDRRCIFEPLAGGAKPFPDRKRIGRLLSHEFKQRFCKLGVPRRERIPAGDEARVELGSLVERVPHFAGHGRSPRRVGPRSHRSKRGKATGR